MHLLAQRGPEHGGLVARHRVSAQPRARCADRRCSTRQAQPQHAITPRTGRDRVRLPRPCVQRFNRGRLRQFEAPGLLLDRPWQDLERDLEDHAERAERAGEQARHVVTRDVLHDFAAEGKHARLAVEQPGTEHVVAQRTGCDAARPG
jgi:hypothetical protein